MSYFTQIRDIFINDRGVVKENELGFFEKGLIKHGNLNSKPESSTLKIIKPLIESNNDFETFLNNYKFLVDIINSSKEHKDSVLGELQLKFNSEKFKDDERMKKIAQLLNLNFEDKSSSEEQK